MSAKLSCILGIAPNSRGFGWIVFDAPFNVRDFGMVFVRSDKNDRSLRHYERLLDWIEPETVVLEEGTPKVHRLRELHHALRISAIFRDIEIASYRRADIQRCFATVGAQTNQEIAEAVAKQVPGVAHKLPRRRAAWTSEDRRQTLFWAAALVMTHFHDSGDQFLQGLKRAA